MSTEQLNHTSEKQKPALDGELEIFAGYVKHFEQKAHKSKRNKLIGKLSIGTEKGKTDILQVASQKSMDRELGLSMVKRAEEASKLAAEDKFADPESKFLGASTEKDGVKRLLTVSVDRTAERNLPTHGDMGDSLNFKITTLGAEGQSHSTSYSVGLNGEVSLTGPDGDISKIHANSDSASRMAADLDSFPLLTYPSELPY